MLPSRGPWDPCVYSHLRHDHLQAFFSIVESGVPKREDLIKTSTASSRVFPRAAGLLPASGTEAEYHLRPSAGRCMVDTCSTLRPPLLLYLDLLNHQGPALTQEKRLDAATCDMPMAFQTRAKNDPWPHEEGHSQVQ